MVWHVKQLRGFTCTAHGFTLLGPVWSRGRPWGKDRVPRVCSRSPDASSCAAALTEQARGYSGSRAVWRGGYIVWGYSCRGLEGSRIFKFDRRFRL